jgi:hypothetical protein
LDTQLLIANNLNFVSKEDYLQLTDNFAEIGKMVSGLIKFRKGKPNS